MNNRIHTIKVVTHSGTVEMARFMEENKADSYMSDHDYFHRPDGERLDSDWSGAETIGQFKDLMWSGVSDADLLALYKNRIREANMGVGVRKEPKVSVAGGSVIVPRYVAGIPTCMRKMAKVERPKKTIHLVMDITVSCRYSAEEVTKASTYVAAAIERVIRLGYSVRLDVLGTAYCNSEHVVIISGVTVKGYCDHLSNPRLAFWCGHPAALRGAMFAHWAARSDMPEYEAGWSLGCGLNYAVPMHERDAVYRKVFGDDVIPISLADLLKRGYRTDEEWMDGLQTTLLGAD